MRDSMTSIGFNGRFSDDSKPCNILALIATFYTPVCPRRGYLIQLKSILLYLLVLSLYLITYPHFIFPPPSYFLLSISNSPHSLLPTLYKRSSVSHLTSPLLL
jgi:hypothetical protein